MKVAGKIFVMLVILALILVPLAACEGEETAGVTAITVPAGEPGATGEQGPAGPPGRAGEEGATGAQGPAGEDGATWFTGAGVPAATTGVTGDLYLNTVNGDVYKKGTSAWSKITNITGPAGPRGAAGATGASGAPGTTMVTCPFVVPCAEIYLGDECSDLLTVDATSVFECMVYLEDGLDVDGTAEFDGTVVANSNVYLQSNLDVDGTTDLDGALYVDGNITLGDTVCEDTLTVNADAKFYCDLTVYNTTAHLNIEADNGTLIIGPDVLNPTTPDVRFKVDGPTGSLSIGPDVLGGTPDIRFNVVGGTGETTVMGSLHPQGDIHKYGSASASNPLIISTDADVTYVNDIVLSPEGVAQLRAHTDTTTPANDFVATYGFLDPQGDILKTTGLGILYIDTAGPGQAIVFRPDGSQELAIKDAHWHVAVDHDLYVGDDTQLGTDATYGTGDLTTLKSLLDPQGDIEKSTGLGDLEIASVSGCVVLMTGGVTAGAGQWQLKACANGAGDNVAIYGFLDPQGDILKTTGALDIATSSGAITISPSGSLELTIDDSAANEVTIENDLQVKGLSDLVGQVSIGTAGLDMSGQIDLNGNNLIAGGTLNANFVLVNGYNAVTHPTLSGQMIQGKTVVGLNPYDPYNYFGGGATPALTATFNFPTMVDQAVVSCTPDALSGSGAAFDGLVVSIKSIVGNTVTIEVYVEGTGWGSAGHLLELSDWWANYTGGIVAYNLSGITFYVIATGH